MIKMLFFFLMLLGVNLKPQHQLTNKKDLYLYFKIDSLNSVSKRLLNLENAKTGRDYNYELYDFLYTAEQSRHYQFVNKLGVKPKIVNSRIIKQFKLKSIAWLKELKEPLPSTSYKDFPYKKMYLVEKLKTNNYKIIEIESFMGKDY